MTKDCPDIIPFPRVGTFSILMRSRLHPFSHFPVRVRISPLHPECSRNERLGTSSSASRTCVLPNDGRSRERSRSASSESGSMTTPPTTPPCLPVGRLCAYALTIQTNCSTMKPKNYAEGLPIACHASMPQCPGASPLRENQASLLPP